MADAVGLKGCFLCTPREEWVIEESENFYAMLGLGPIVEGYSLIASRAHGKSMFDVDDDQVSEVTGLVARVRQRLSPFGSAVVTEHGRVAPCESRDDAPHEAHCYHAHFLVFPVAVDLTDQMADVALSTREFPDFLSARHGFEWPDEYLYFERPDGSCVTAVAPLPHVRQFFRRSIATAVGHPERTSWRSQPGLALITSAMERLGLTSKCG